MKKSKKIEKIEKNRKSQVFSKLRDESDGYENMQTEKLKIPALNSQAGNAMEEESSEEDEEEKEGFYEAKLHLRKFVRLKNQFSTQQKSLISWPDTPNSTKRRPSRSYRKKRSYQIQNPTDISMTSWSAAVSFLDSWAVVLIFSPSVCCFQLHSITQDKNCLCCCACTSGFGFWGCRIPCWPPSLAFSASTSYLDGPLS